MPKNNIGGKRKTSENRELEELKKELDYIYQNTTKAFRQRATMVKRIAHISDRIVELESKERKNAKK